MKIKQFARDKSDMDVLFQEIVPLSNIKNGKTILQIGARPGGSQGWRAVYEGFKDKGYKTHDILEIWEPNANALKSTNTGGSIILGDMRNINELVKTPYDVIMAHHSLEHLTKQDALDTLIKLEKLANIAVIIGVPLGIWEQGPIHNNPYETHLSSWYAEDFINLSYDVYTFGIKDNGVMLCVKLLN